MPAAAPSASPLRYLALGDSYTVGEGVDAADAWPAQLVSGLRGSGLDLAAPRTIAVTGWTCAELQAGMDAAALAPPYALVTLQVGVNDQYRGHPLDAYQPQFAALLARAVALAGGTARRVVVVSIPDWGVTPFARGDARGGATIAAELDTFNAAARTQALAAGAHWCNVTGVSRAHAGLLAADGLHPDARQYRLWTACIAPAARLAALGSR